MNKHTILVIILFLFIIFLSGCAKVNSQPITITVSAAISLTDALEEIGDMYEADHETTLIFVLGSSGKLAQQIQQGAPIDVFIAANEQWMDVLEGNEQILADTRSDIANNRLVIIGGKESQLNLDTLINTSAHDIDNIAIGNPASVPAGKYAKTVLSQLNLWQALEDKFVFAKDVRQVLTYVETGNADIGFVYESDALQSKNVRIIDRVDAKLHDPIIYQVAITTDSGKSNTAQDFINFLKTDAVQQVFLKHGFKK